MQPHTDDPADTGTRERALLDAIPTAICNVDAATRAVLSVNAAFLALTGLTEEQVLGAVHPYPWWGEDERTREVEDGARYGRIFRRADGHPVPVEIELRAIRDPDGRVSTYLGVVTDLTERRRLEQQLVQSGKLAAIGELSAGVAHEINNPLFAILGLVEFLLKDAEAGTKAHERLLLIQSTALEIKQIVRALLDFARERSDDYRAVGLDAVVQETINLIRRTSANKGIEIVEQVGEGVFLVDGSPNQLKQVVLNLLANAQQAMPDGGTITISVEETDEAVTATVADTGPGIPAERCSGSSSPSSRPSATAAARGSASRSASASPRATAAASRPRHPRAAARSSPCDCRGTRRSRAGSR